jgi:hypothetical protein
MDTIREKKINDEIKKLYENPKNPASFGGVERFIKSLKNKNIKRKQIKIALSNTDSYTQHKPIRKRFQTRRIIVPYPNHTFALDLCDMTNIKSENKNFKFLLTCIDIFSKKGYVSKMKNKSAKSTTDAFEEIIKKAKSTPKFIHVDEGKEFYNKTFKSFLKSKNIRMYSTNSENKSSVVERFNRTLKTKMYKYFTAVQNKNWVKIINDLVESYNNTHHRSIKTTPNTVNKENEKEIFLNLYGFRANDSKSFPKQIIKNNPFAINDKVRITKIKNTFDKAYLKGWTTELFVIDKIIGTNPITFKLKDLFGEVIKGSFYKEEIQIANNHNKIFQIQKILKKKKKNNITYLFVRWQGYSKKYDSWTPEENVKVI